MAVDHSRRLTGGGDERIQSFAFVISVCLCVILCISFLVDDSGGASNIAVRNEAGRDLILAANREIGEVALYEISP